VLDALTSISSRRRRAFATAFAISIAGAAVAGVLVARGELAQAYGESLQRFERLSKVIPLYRDSSFYPMGKGLHVDGVSREMAYAVTSDPVWKVADWYEGLWTSQGFQVQRNTVGGEEWIMAMDAHDPWMRTIAAVPGNSDGDDHGGGGGGGGQTTILASVRPLDTPAAKPKLPVANDCAVISHNGAKDMGVATEMMYLSCNGYVGEVVDFYDEVLYGAVRRGEIHQSATNASGRLVYSSDGLEVILSLQQTSVEPPRVVVSLTWQERERHQESGLEESGLAGEEKP